MSRIEIVPAMMKPLRRNRQEQGMLKNLSKPCLVTNQRHPRHSVGLVGDLKTRTSSSLKEIRNVPEVVRSAEAPACSEKAEVTGRYGVDQTGLRTKTHTVETQVGKGISP